MDIVTLALAKKYADEKLTNVKVDLTGYAKEDYVDAEIEELNKKIVQETGKLSEEKVDQKELENYALKDEIPTVPVQSVNGKTGAVQLSASEVGALPNSTKIPTKTSDLTNDSGFITNLVNNLANYYLKSETYTQEEINQKLSIIPKFSIKVVSSLPTSDINDTTVYLVKSGEDENNLYTEYIYVDGAWELLGKQSVDLSDYALKSDIPTTLSELTNDAGFITKYVSDLENYYVKNDVYNKDEIDAKGYLTEHQDISGLAPKATTLAGYGITDGVTNEQIEQFSGTVEITSDAPTKEQTVLTINPESETVNLYTAEEVDEKFNQLSEEIVNYLPKNQGASNVGKILVVGTDGNLVLTDMPEGGTTGDVTGVLDDSNNILLTGNLADGTYTLKWCNDDGTYSDAGTIEVGAIPEPKPTKTNFADPTSADWVNGRISNGAANGIQNDSGEYTYATNYIPVQKGDIITINANIKNNMGVYMRFAVYSGTSHDTRIYTAGYADSGADTYLNMLSESEFEIMNDSVNYIRFTLTDVDDVNKVTINIQRDGEWL